MEDNTNTNIDVNDDQQVSSDKEVKTYTQEEVLKLLQSETDKRVNQALATEQKKAEKDNRIAELEEQLAQFQIERNRSELKSVLSSRGLSAEFADIILINDDIEASQANIDKLDKLFKAAVKAEVEKRLAGNAPKGNGNSLAEITKESVQKMSIAQLSELEQQNPELFERLFK